MDTILRAAYITPVAVCQIVAYLIDNTGADFDLYVNIPVVSSCILIVKVTVVFYFNRIAISGNDIFLGAFICNAARQEKFGAVLVTY